MMRFALKAVVGEGRALQGRGNEDPYRRVGLRICDAPHLYHQAGQRICVGDPCCRQQGQRICVG